MPAEFWQTEQLCDAFAAQYMGWVSHAYRLHPYHQPVYGPSGIPQGLLGQWLGLSQPQVSRIENGPPIRNLDTLAYWARILHIPPESLWFRLLSEKRQGTTTEPAASLTAPVSNGVLEPPTETETRVAPTVPHLFQSSGRLVVPGGQEIATDIALRTGVELAEGFARPLDYLMFLSSAARAVPGEQGDRISDQLTKLLRRWAGTMNRREFLQLFGWAATTIADSPVMSGLDDEEQERLARAIVAPSRVDTRVIEHLAAVLRHCKQQDDVLGPRAVLHTVRVIHSSSRRSVVR